MSLEPDHIQSVVDNTDATSVSLHTYGLHINHTGRFQYDIENNRGIPYVVVEQ